MVTNRVPDLLGALIVGLPPSVPLLQACSRNLLMVIVARPKKICSRYSIISLFQFSKRMSTRTVVPLLLRVYVMS